jgi:hypothetical protein
MKILFAMEHPEHLCALGGVARLLGERGHGVHLVFGGVKTDASRAVLERLVEESPPGLSIGTLPRPGKSRWKDLTRDLRHSVNYVRYLEPVYADAPKLRARAERGAPLTARRLGRMARLFGPAGVVGLRRTLQSLEQCIEPSSTLQSFLVENGTDVVIATHLVSGSPNTLVRAAKRLGIRTGYLVFSWDNLTNKGLIHEIPDAVLVWNELQAREAVELHGVPRERVQVTGAPLYDHWFSSSPSRSREEFCRVVGLRPDRPIVLYVCSSPFVAPDEAGFVSRWVDALRAHGGALADAGILVRPHPRGWASWADVQLQPPQTAVWPPLGQAPMDDEARHNYFDSLYHSDAVVGINTSAQIEAAIVGRPVHTVLVKEFREGQHGTLHFHYLNDAEFGHLHVGHTIEEHAALLEASLREVAGDGRNEQFLRRFVRPLGLDIAATPRIVDEIEELAARPSSPDGGPALGPLVRLGLRPLAAVCARRHLQRPRRRQAAPMLRQAVRQLAKDPPEQPVVAGPWLDDEIEELLFWIPFLRWAQSATIGLRDRLAVVSRAESAYWYAGVGSRHLSLDELQAGNGLPSPELLARALGIRNGAMRVLPAEVVASGRAKLASGRLTPHVWDRRLDFEPLAAPQLPNGIDLPDEFLAVCFPFAAAFPDSEPNRRLVLRAIAALATAGPLVVLDPPGLLGGALDTLDVADLRVVSGAKHALQSAVLARARGFVGSYGTAAFLAVLHGVDAVALYTASEFVDDGDLRVVASFLNGPQYGRLSTAQATGTPEEEAARAVAVLGQRTHDLALT